MTAAALLHQCHNAGLALRLDHGDIVISGPADARSRLLPEIRQAKPALVAILAADHQADIEEATAERAAIMEHDGGLPRDRAQAVAELAGQFYAHHWSCPTCRAGTQAGAKLHRPCPDGVALWADYCQAAGREARP